jgi:hypothetical protein
VSYLAIVLVTLVGLYVAALRARRRAASGTDELVAEEAKA